MAAVGLHRGEDGVTFAVNWVRSAPVGQVDTQTSVGVSPFYCHRLGAVGAGEFQGNVHYRSFHDTLLSGW